MFLSGGRVKIRRRLCEQKRAIIHLYAGIRREEAVAFPVFCLRAQDRLVNALLNGFEPPLVCESLRGVKGRESLRK